MNDIVDILPMHARKHYINLRNVRDSKERADYNTCMDELKDRATQRGLFQSGWFLQQSAELKTKLLDALAYGYAEEALTTCRLYDVELTRPICASIEEATRSMLAGQYRNLIRSQGAGTGSIQISAKAITAISQQIENKRFNIMPKVSVMVEAARVEDEGRRRAMTKPVQHSNVINYVQNVHQQGPGNAASQLGDVSSHIIVVNDFEALSAELAQLRISLKAGSTTLDADESVGLLASAEKASQNRDDKGVFAALGKISKNGWELIKATAPQVTSQMALHYLKLHGLA